MPQSVVDLNAALAPGLPGAATVDTAISQALAYWTGQAGNSVDPYDDTAQSAATAIALLNAERARIRNPAQ